MRARQAGRPPSPAARPTAPGRRSLAGRPAGYGLGPPTPERPPSAPSGAGRRPGQTPRWRAARTALRRAGQSARRRASAGRVGARRRGRGSGRRRGRRASQKAGTRGCGPRARARPSRPAAWPGSQRGRTRRPGSGCWWWKPAAGGGESLVSCCRALMERRGARRTRLQPSDMAPSHSSPAALSSPLTRHAISSILTSGSASPSSRTSKTTPSAFAGASTTCSPMSVRRSARSDGASTASS